MVATNKGGKSKLQKTSVAKKAGNKPSASGKKYPITFITGNKKKLEEFLSIITGSPLE